MKKLPILIYLMFNVFLLQAQISFPNIGLYGGGSAGIGDTKPFWNVSNQYGKYSLSPIDAMAGVKIEAIDTSGSFISLDYGFEGYLPATHGATFRIHEGYLAINTPLLTFRAGRREEVIGNQDTLLSTGGTVWSSNAMPMPKLVIATPGYVDVPFTKGYVEVNGSLAHGWFEEDRYVKNVYLHQKHAHIRFGGDFFLNFSLGLIHFAQWGGVSPNPRFEDLPADWDAYKRVFFVQQGDPGTVDTAEVINKLGNHLGARNYRIDYNHDRFTASFYFQTIFEDNSGLSKLFYEDGIKGLTFKMRDKQKIVNQVVLEYMQTTYQSGPVHDIFSDSIKLKGNDNYFNHAIYNSGWSYLNMTLGTPLITSPIFNDDSKRGIINNRVMAFHIGIGGKVESLNYSTFFTYYINRGTFKHPFPSHKNQFSWYFETTIPEVWLGIDLKIMLAADIGQMYGNNLGVNFLLSKSFKPFHK